MLATAKGIGGGFPMGACLATEKVASALTAGSHGSTFGGNPLAMAVGNAVLDVMLADGFFANVEKMGGRLRGRLEALVRRYPALYAEVRGVGLLLGLRAVVPNGDVVARLREAGLLTAPAGDNVVRVMPPLIIDESHIDQAMAIFEQVSAAWPAGTA